MPNLVCSSGKKEKTQLLSLYFNDTPLLQNINSQQISSLQHFIKAFLDYTVLLSGVQPNLRTSKQSKYEFLMKYDLSLIWQSTKS